MRSSTGTDLDRLRHWYVGLLLALLAATISIELLQITGLGAILLASEKKLIEHILNYVNVYTIDVSWNSFIAYRPGGLVLTIIMTPSCSGIYAVTAFLASSLSLPLVDRNKKLNALLVYAPVIFFANIVRIVTSVALAIAFGVSVFHFVHNVLGSAVLVLLYAVLWLDWLYRSLKSGGSRLGHRAYYKRV